MSPATIRDDYVLEFEYEGFAELIAKVRQLGDGGERFAKIELAHMRAALDVLGQQIDARTPVNIGALRASRWTDMYGQPLDLTGETGTPLAYGWPMERGRRAGRVPPVDPIEYWVKRKGVQFKDKKTGAVLPTRRTAWIIAIAIARGRTEHQKKGGDRMYEEGLKAAQPYIEKIFDSMIDDFLQELAT